MTKSKQNHSTLEAVQAAFMKVVNIPPYCTGTVPLDSSQSILFYRSKEGASVVDFAKPTEAELKTLAEACSPASFGRNNEDILDENYRKAGKMELADFGIHFSPLDSGVLQTVVESLFKIDERSTADIKVELYKLNVYGPGSFFKAHVDTPRSDTMFGSLVVILPTPHTGGSLLFRHHQIEYTFNSAAAVSESTPDAPYAAFAGFFSDVEHEVAEVTSGYRVTLTYNLYHATPTTAPGGILLSDIADADENALKSVLASFLSNPTFLPDGGLLAFGLSYQYPFNYSSTHLSDIRGRLKGIDALLIRVCESLELNAFLKALYHGERDSIFFDSAYCFMDHFVNFDYAEVEHIVPYLCNDDRAIVGYDEHSNKAIYEGFDDNEVLDVVWAMPPDHRNEFKAQYMAYGNSASIEYAYGKLCLVVRIKPAGERAMNERE